MTRFFKNIIWFFLPLLLVSVLLDWYISDQLKKSDYYAHGETYIWNKIVEGEIEDDIYIYGSSRAWVHINPFILQDTLGMTAYNFGIDGHFLWFQYLRHKLLLENNPTPKIVLLSMDLFTLTRYEDIFAVNQVDNFYNSQQFYPFILNPEIRKFTRTYRGYNRLDYSLPLVRYYGRLEDIQEAFRDKSKFYREQPFRIKGFRMVNRTWNADFEKARKKMKYYEVKINPQYVSLFHNLLKECKQLDIQVVMIYSPEHIFGQEFVKNRKELFLTYEALAKKNKVPFLDYSSDSLCLRKELFYNSQHLNALGSKLFSQKLAHDLKLILTVKKNNHAL